MKDRLKSLVPLGILAVPITVFSGLLWLCDSVLMLTEPFLVSIAVMVALFLGFLRWMCALQKKEDEIVGKIQHPFFGTVRRKQNSWETAMTVQNLGRNLAISSYNDGNVPTKNQQETVSWVDDSWQAITSELEDCLDDFDRDTKSLPPRPRKIVFESILLDADAPKTFCLGFDIEDANLPWGFSAFYADGKIDEFTDNH